MGLLVGLSVIKRLNRKDSVTREMVSFGRSDTPEDENNVRGGVLGTCKIRSRVSIRKKSSR